VPLSAAVARSFARLLDWR